MGAAGRFTRLLMVMLLALCGCRVLPPVPFILEADVDDLEDEAFFKKIEEHKWDSKSLPGIFDYKAVEHIFGKNFFGHDIYHILPPHIYNDSYPEHTAGIRRLFRFYLHETDYVTGLTVFVHEAIHGFNWIDIFDMDYNEFMSIAGELRLVQIIAKQDPDLAVALMGRSMHLFAPRDSFYRDEEHDRARLYLFALLVEDDPDDIYRWARDCSKSEFYNRVHKALGEDVVNIPLKGIKAFAKRHFEGPYIEVLVSTRDEPSAHQRNKIYQKSMEGLKPDYVFYDNMQWQLLRNEAILKQYDKVFDRAEKMWDDTKDSLLASAVAQMAYMATLHLSKDKILQKKWLERANSFSLTYETKNRYIFERIKFLMHPDRLGLNYCFKSMSEWFKSSEFVDDDEFLKLFEDDIVSMINEIVVLAWNEFEKRKNATYLYEILANLDHLSKKMKVFPDSIYGLQCRLEFYMGDREFENKNISKSLEHYDKAKRMKPLIRFQNNYRGLHVLEAEFWDNYLNK